MNLHIMRSTLNEFCLSCAVLMALLCGCDESISDSLAVRAAKDRLSLIRVEVESGSSAFGSRNEISEIEMLIDEVSNLEDRRRLVDEYGQILLDIDLACPPYRRWQNATLGYFPHIDNVVNLMRKNDCSSRRFPKVIIAGMKKLQDACLSVPTGPKNDGETLQEYSWRRDCARKLKEEYTQRMSEIRRFWLPHLNEHLPAECHDEFRENIAPFLRAAE